MNFQGRTVKLRGCNDFFVRTCLSGETCNRSRSLRKLNFQDKNSVGKGWKYKSIWGPFLNFTSSFRVNSWLKDDPKMLWTTLIAPYKNPFAKITRIPPKRHQKPALKAYDSNDSSHLFVANFGCNRWAKTSLPWLFAVYSGLYYSVIKGSLVANFRYTNFWVAGEE